MEERITTLDSDSPLVGQICIKCGKPLEAQSAIVECPRCHRVVHADCWQDKGGCSTHGCPQIAKAVVKEKPKGDGPPPPIPRSHIVGGIFAIILLFLAMFFWPKPPDPAMGRTKVVFMTEGALEEQNILNRIVDEFNDNHEEIYIDLQILPFGLMDQKLVVLIAAGEGPDIFALTEDRYEQYAQHGALLELEDADYQYGYQHPGMLRIITAFVNTPEVDATLEVMDYLVSNLPAADLDAMREYQDARTRNGVPMQIPGPIGF